MKKKSYYRPDIDGLRAFAVLPVILFHLGISGFSGGFVGVDVFFVISGYLITSIILRQMHHGTFSLLTFWERRMRRILPAMFTVLIATTVAAYFITIYPVDFKLFGTTLAAQSVFLSNVYLMRYLGYFSAPADTIHLLHTWSLAVEEQFYLFFPLALIAVFYIARRHLVLALSTLAFLSFALSVYLINYNPYADFVIPGIPHIWGEATNTTAGFYLFPARAWELLAGGLLASVGTVTLSQNKSRIFSWLGILGLGYSFVVFSNTTVFPGYNALLPVLSTVLIIASGSTHHHFVNKILSFPIFVWIGMISYPLYLWHWPLIVLLKEFWITRLPTHFAVIILLLTFLLAIATYYFIETPFRTGHILTSKRYVFATALSVSLALFVTGFMIYTHDGLPSRNSEQIQELTKPYIEASNNVNPRRGECFETRQPNDEPCILGNATGKEGADFVLWGDSHAEAIMPAFDQAAKDLHMQGVVFEMSACPPLLTKEEISNRDACNNEKKRAIEFINTHEIKHIFLVGRWKDAYKSINKKQETSLEDALLETFSKIGTDVKITVVKSVPQQTNYVLANIFYQAVWDEIDVSTLIIPYATHLNSSKKANKMIDSASAAIGVTTIDPGKEFCDAFICRLQKNDRILYTDSSHINYDGAILLVPFITKALLDQYQSDESY